MRTVRRLLALALFVGVLVLGWNFAGQNPEPVQVALPLLEPLPPKPLWLVLVVSFGAGALLVGLVALYDRARLSLTARRWRKTADRLEAEVHQLRNLPLAASRDGVAPPGSGGSPAAPAPERSAQAG